MIKSPKLTAEWENDLTLISRGQKNAEEFLSGIEKMVTKLVSDNGQPAEEYQKLFSDGRKEIGNAQDVAIRFMWEREIIIVQEVIAVLLYGKITDFLRVREKHLMKQLSGSC